MVAPLRVELNPPAFQTGTRTRYAREPQKWIGRQASNLYVSFRFS